MIILDAISRFSKGEYIQKPEDEKAMGGEENENCGKCLKSPGAS